MTRRPAHPRALCLRDEAGQTVALLVLVLTVMLGISGTVLDVGAWYHAQRRDQSIADAAALAAAQGLPDANQAVTLAEQYASSNGGSLGAGDIAISSVSAPNDTVTVHINEAQPTFFAKIFGFNSVNVSATAAAQFSTLGSAEYVAPFGIVSTEPALAGPGCPCFQTTTTLTLDKVGPGGFKIINVDGSSGGNGGPGTLADWIQNGYDGMMPLGWYSSMPGAKFNSSLVQDAMQQRIGTDLLFPVYDIVQGQGANLQYHVIGWAAFHLLSFDFSGNSGTITGWFTKVTWSGIDTTTVGSNYGATFVKLVQ